MTNRPSKRKQIAAAALALLCSFSFASASQLAAGNCFVVTTPLLQDTDSFYYESADSCNAALGERCFRQKGPGIPQSDGSATRFYSPVEHCTKYDYFDPAGYDSDQDGVPDYEDADADNDGGDGK